jgi:hypothetical protein
MIEMITGERLLASIDSSKGLLVGRVSGGNLIY